MNQSSIKTKILFSEKLPLNNDEKLHLIILKFHLIILTKY